MAGPLQTTMFNGVTPFYPGVATSSQRFDIASSSYLTYTPSSATSATDRRKMTWSGWIKRNALGVQQALYSARKDTSGSDYFLIAFAAGDTLRVIFDVEDANEGYESDAIYRDVGQWYHFCIIIFRSL